MPRTARIVIAGCAHHVTQRGNDGQAVFVGDEDREVFLAYLREASECFGLTIEGYCLMGNHVHVIATPDEEASLALALKRTNQLYAQYTNRVHGHRGHLWQDRFFSCPLDDAHFWKALAYVERNPVRARLCRKPWRWVWSSAAAHCGGQDGSGLLDLNGWTKQIDTALPLRAVRRVVGRTAYPLATDNSDFLAIGGKLGHLEGIIAQINPYRTCRLLHNS
jgi:REP-associated tyrosine transposase